MGQVITFNENIENIEEIIEKWAKIGFLDGLEDREEIKCIATSFEIAARYLISDEAKYNIFGEKKYNDLDTLTFPVLRRALVKYDGELRYDVKKIEEFTLDLINDLNKKLLSINFIAEFTSRYSDNFDVKKYFK
jgi:hypothetical protein